MTIKEISNSEDVEIVGVSLRRGNHAQKRHTSDTHPGRGFARKPSYLEPLTENKRE
jgi:hypothetical protein